MNYKLYFKKESVYTQIDYEEADQYIGEEGYFGDSLGDLNKAIIKREKKHLMKVWKDPNDGSRFVPEEYGFSSSLFIPASKVEEIHRVYEPFTDVNELKSILHIYIGASIHIRKKGDFTSEKILSIGGFCKYTNSLYIISIGWVTFSELCSDYEIINPKGKYWMPFGKDRTLIEIMERSEELEEE